jgi:uncharacterized protein (UPF0276 family)
MSPLLQNARRLGVGISCEFNGGTRAVNLDAVALREAWPELIHFLEVGADTRRGLDEHMRRWAAQGWPTTYHFLDLNLAELEDLDPLWVQRTQAIVAELGAAWVCGDAGYWHVGPREPVHDVLLPPVLTRSSAAEMAQAVRALSAALNTLVVPENPPAVAYVGPLHLLDYYAQVVSDGDCGFLLDCSHLAIFQASRGLPPLAAFDGFPWERVVELHIAGGRPRVSEGLVWMEDTHDPEPTPEAWAVFEAALSRAKNLKAVVYECEHNPAEEVHDNFVRLNDAFPVEG